MNKEEFERYLNDTDSPVDDRLVRHVRERYIGGLYRVAADMHSYQIAGRLYDTLDMVGSQPYFEPEKGFCTEGTVIFVSEVIEAQDRHIDTFSVVKILIGTRVYYMYVTGLVACIVKGWIERMD